MRPVVWVLMVPCMWWLTVVLVTSYVVARNARRAFPPRPEGRIEDRTVLKVQRGRAWAALAMSGGLLAVYGGVSDAWDQFVQRLYLAPWLALASAVLVAAVLYWAARPERRLLMRAQFRGASLSILGYIGAWVLVPVLFVATLMIMGALLPHTVTEVTMFLMYVPVLALWAPFWWIVYFVCFASGPAVRNGCSLSAAHPALPALTTCAAVWVFALVSRATAGGLPPVLEPLAAFGGPASVTVLVWWEIHRLRHQHGMRWRG
ncbi:hypothetical protein [Streptomyces sp. ITFR-16]|uniref:hypothetical protein n=1 Tax=Streptomyces sp. ITFR-16 TaxID=3075198 RepID=UPI002889A3FB|nr:hypothetical protein [Streptomyces sp. ITFR-16]WNI21405.1 hypothetical protein RLT58_05445 [Streptomyces sp. ITFR-16]